MWRMLPLVLCTFFGGALVGTGTARQATEAAYALSQPSQWIAFSADVLHMSAIGRQSSGKFYRSADGSTRHDIRLDYGTTIVPEIRIENFAERTFYYNDGREQWMTGPLEWPEYMFHPRSWSSRAIGLSPYRHKVALLRGQDGSLFSDTGLDAWQFTNDAGTTQVLAQALNFFPVVHSRVDGQRRSYLNITLEQANPDLFRPPPGAPLEQGARRPLRGSAADGDPAERDDSQLGGLPENREGGALE